MNSDMSALLGLKWQKSERSLSNGECVEVARAGAWIAVRDSKDPQGGMLDYSERAWRSFITKIVLNETPK
jgi:hypothetical protein